jgi:transposase-like protein
MILTGLISWRTGLFRGLLILIFISSFLPQTDSLLPAVWWLEQQRRPTASWRVVRRALPLPRWWGRVHRAYRWGRAGIWLGLSLWLLGHLLTRPAPTWAWLCLVAISHVAGGLIHQLLLDWVEIRPVKPIEASIAPPAAGSDSLVEVTVDLEPLLAELGDLSPTSEVTTTAREALTARLERIRAECFQHSVSQALMGQLDDEVQHLVKRLVEEALVRELDEYLGFGHYERTGSAKPAHQHRSGHWTRALRTMWGRTEIRVPKLRRGNKARPWQVLERYERSFGPWLDLQLHLYRLGLSQRDLQEMLHLSFGQVLSVKAIEHLTDVAQKEMEACRQARLDDTPPIILVDGVNLKVMCPTGTYCTNQRGRRREVNRREERVLLAVLGVWPAGHHRILYFEMVDRETKDNWKMFFRHLVSKGLDTSQLQLVVSDGRPGLHTAIRSVFPQTVKHQRCIFHKLKNLADNLTYNHLTLNPDLPHREALKQAKETRARAVLREAADIYTGSDIAVIKQRLADFQQKWASLEPKAVRCFLKDFDLTLNYLRVPFPHKKLTRTNNLLERFFREFRSRADEIGCFGSQAQANTLFYLVMQREKAKHAVTCK